MAPCIGMQLGGYRLDALIGRGGGGVVYRATHLRLDRTVALKVLPEELVEDKGFRRRFEHEAKVAASLDPAHIVPVYDAGEADNLLYLVMRFIDGADLGRLIQTQGPLHPMRVCALLDQVADALDAAHKVGLVHRDVKPGNILVAPAQGPGRPEHAFLSDFGLTRRLEGTSVTGGLVAGTLAYMAPERFRAGAQPNAAIDVYALGCVGYACLSGSPPFGGASFEAVMAAHMFEPLPSTSHNGVVLPAAVDAVLAVATAKQPDDRYPSCGAFVHALRVAGQTGYAQPAVLPPPWTPPAGPAIPPADTRPTSPGGQRHRRTVIGTAAAALLLIAVLAVVLARTGPAPAPVATPATVAAASPLPALINGLAVDPAGNVYVATLLDDRVQKVTPAGTISTVAGGNGEGFGGDGGPANAAQLNAPQGLALDAAGNLYIADTANHRIRRVDPTGFITTIAGNGSQSGDGDGGPAARAQFQFPVDVAVGGDGTLYVAEAEGRRVRAIDPRGRISTVAGNGIEGFSGDGGPATEAELSFPLALAVDGDRNIYIADNSNARIRRVDRAGTITTVAGTGTGGSAGDDGPATAAELTNPGAVAVDGSGVLYIGDGSGDRIRRVDRRGIITTVAGSGIRGYAGDGGPATQARLARPDAVAVGPDGSLYIGDDRNHRIRKVDLGGTIAGAGAGYPGDGGPATQGFLHTPTITLLDGAGRLYISDSDNDRIRRVERDGTIVTIAGTGENGYSGDGGQATAAQLNFPVGLAVGPDGTVFIADAYNHRIRRVDPTGFITTIAGIGRGGYSRDGLPAGEAELGLPFGLTLDGAGNLYVAEYGTSRIRKIDATGVLTTVAGTGTAGYSGDGGPATLAQLNQPYDVHLDGSGNLYVADQDNHRIRRIDTAGVITTVAGTGTAGDAGDGAPAVQAQLSVPDAVTSDGAGNVYIGDTGNNRVRRIDPAGTITTLAGSGIRGFSVDGVQAVGARLDGPVGIAIDAQGDIYIAEASNGRICRLDAGGILTTFAGERR